MDKDYTGNGTPKKFKPNRLQRKKLRILKEYLDKFRGKGKTGGDDTKKE